MLRITTMILAAGVMFAAPAAWAVLPGDCDGNGVVDAADAEIARDALGTAAGDDGFVAAADVDGDGAVSLVDLNAILQASSQ